MAASNGEDITCNYCLQTLPHMIDPRELPCYHIFCLPCLQSDYNISAGIQCTVCRKQYDSIEPTNLKSCTVDDTTEPKAEYYCFVCDDVLSAGYCLTCGQHNCVPHLKKHMEVKHNTIDIGTFNINPSTYSLVFCDEHKKEISMVCSGCLMFACVRCDTLPGGKVCPNTVSGMKITENASKNGICYTFPPLMPLDHSMVPLRSMQRLVEKELDEKLKVSADKITEISKLEKEVWLKLDSEGTNNEALQNQLTNEVEVFVCTLMSIKDQLEVIQRSIRQLQRESHITEVIKQKPQKISELDEICSKASEIIRSRRDGTDDLEGLFRQLTTPSILAQDQQGTHHSLQLAYTATTNSTCFSVKYKNDGELVVACNNRVFIYDRDFQRCESIKVKRPFAAMEYDEDGEIYFIDNHSGKVEVWTVPYGKGLTNQVRSFNKNAWLEDLAMYDDYLAVIVDQRIHVISDNNTRYIYRQQFWEPNFLCYSSDGGLLVVSTNGGLIIKYRPGDPQFEEVEWLLEGLDNPSGVCEDEDGLILVGGERQVYMISPAGMLRGTLQHLELPYIPGSMDIRGNVLAVACDQDCCFKLFNFVYNP